MRRTLATFLTALLVLPMAYGWGAHVHRTITYLALEGLPPDVSPWLRDPATADRAAFQANQPDRWRGWRSDALKHVNDPDHYLDADQLGEFGLTLDTIPKLRREYLKSLAIAKYAHPENVAPYDADKDPARANEWPGFVLHAATEEYAKLQAAFNQVRILEQLNEPARRHQLEQSRAIAIYHIGNLSHFIGDIAQPLHTTKHYNGWLGDNPAGYKWRDRFHSYIDEGFADQHGVGLASLRPQLKFDGKVNAADPWADILAAFKRSHALMEPLYALERDGKLDGDEGAKLINGQLVDAVTTLSALIQAAYNSAAPTDDQVKSWVHYNAFDPARLPPDIPPTTQPAPAAKPSGG